MQGYPQSQNHNAYNGYTNNAQQGYQQGGQMTYQQQAPQQQYGAQALAPQTLAKNGGPASGQLVAMELITERYNKETKMREPVTPHVSYKYKLQDGSYAYIKKWLSEKAMKYAREDANKIGCGAAAFLEQCIQPHDTALFGKLDDRGYMNWGLSQQQHAGANAQAPAPAPCAPAPQQYQQPPAQQAPPQANWSPAGSGTGAPPAGDYFFDNGGDVPF